MQRILKKTDIKGQTLVEFVIVFYVFMLLALGVLQWAYIGVNAIVINHAVFQVARVGSVTDDKRTMERAADLAIPFKNKEDISLKILSNDDSQDLNIELSYKVPLFFPIINKLIKEALQLDEYKLPIKAEYMMPKEGVTIQ
ncbi:MAG: TadE family protein [Elusimicrobiota bacterium]